VGRRRAEWIVTGDRDFVKAEREGIRIVDSRRLLEVLDARGGSRRTFADLAR